MKYSQTEQAYQRLRAEILECALMPGSGITEAGTVERLGVGKTPVREALQRLVREGLVLVVPRQGYFVAPISLQDVEEVFTLRALVEPEAMALAAGKLEPSLLRHLHQLAKAGYDPSNLESVQHFLRINTEFHSQIARAAKQRRLADVVEQALSESRRLVVFGMLLAPRSEEAKTEHEALLAALEQNKPDLVRQIASAQIAASRAMVLASLRQSHSVLNAPIHAV
jgi:DNA-binding GntR family transcriptional regulator